MVRSRQLLVQNDVGGAQKLVTQLSTPDAGKLSLPERADVRADEDLIYRLTGSVLRGNQQLT